MVVQLAADLVGGAGLGLLAEEEVRESLAEVRIAGAVGELLIDVNGGAAGALIVLGGLAVRVAVDGEGALEVLVELVVKRGGEVLVFDVRATGAIGPISAREERHLVGRGVGAVPGQFDLGGIPAFDGLVVQSGPGFSLAGGGGPAAVPAHEGLGAEARDVDPERA